jgi:hypothetical protein
MGDGSNAVAMGSTSGGPLPLWWTMMGHSTEGFTMALIEEGRIVDVSYVAPQAHIIVNVAIHLEYSLGIIFLFSQGRKDLYHV